MEKSNFNNDLEGSRPLGYDEKILSNQTAEFGNDKDIFTYTDTIPEAMMEENKAIHGVGSKAIEEAGGKLRRDLKARHITMIAIGGALGTGLVIGSGSALAQAGPAALFLSFIIVGFIVYLVMCALGEMATWLPLSEGFPGYASRFCDPCLGFAVGWVYYFKYIIVTPNQLVAGALVIQYWLPREKVNPGVWITVFLVVIILLNMFGVKIFGELEFWLSCLKVITMLGLIITTFIIALGGGPDHDRRGFRYWKNPGAFKEYSKNGHTIEGPEGRFVAWASVLVTAVFAFLGTELVGVTVGEAENPRRNIPRAIKLTFYRILLFYVVSTLFLGMCVPYNDSKLAFANTATTSAAASPFVVAISNAGIGKLNQIINACILIFIFSSSNSDLYIATRTLYAMAANGKAPKIFLKVNRWGIPYVSLLFSSMFCGLAYLSTSQSSAKVFTYFVNVVSIMGLLTWICILITHICFVKGMKAQGIPDSEIVYKAPFRPYGSWIALGFCIVIALIKNFTAFVFKFDKTAFITGYIGIPIFLILILGYKVIMKTKYIKPTEIDFYPSLRHEIDREEEEFLKQQIQDEIDNPPSMAKKIYNNTLGYLF
ncbi:uncharacterized protein SAPINGB_P001184 [Magnusiomyces paraingens]|uniref:Amino acid permease/ SLC12A domain-containing protein n=1 Tax=Magnusiomyces paraingens TaxID=2606893 RepID=A0A5E8B4F7_9ASCO|nr:uncharacterized protein SAPINGB_P001184 [Saprochaete ingens]VVT46379.1 unnamed protein product [Saprochaete ingens]